MDSSTPSSPDIFISYAREDRARVEPLVEILAQHGWRVWWDFHVRTGEYFRDKIVDALNQSACVVVLWSEQSVHSDWVLHEAEEGRKRRILVPVQLGPVVIPPPFGNIQTANFVGWSGREDDDKVRALIDDIRALTGAPAVSESVSDEREPARQTALDTEKPELLNTDSENNTGPPPVNDPVLESPEPKFVRKRAPRYVLPVVVLLFTSVLVGVYLFNGPTMEESQALVADQASTETDTLTEQPLIVSTTDQEPPQLQGAKPVEALIEQIESLIDNRRLTLPKDNNANALLTELETLDPDNAFIAEGRRRIRSNYSVLIDSALLEGDIERANRYLASLGKVSGSEAIVERLRKQIDQSTVSSAQKADFIAPDMVRIPGGTFMMGSDNGEDNEKPVHRVQVPAFEMARNELTWQEWHLCEADGGCSEVKWPDFLKDIPGAEKPRHPVVYMTVERVNEYLSWINEKTGLVYRLPSESEWEYAARAGTTTAYSWGDDIGENRANCFSCESSWDEQSTTPVGSFDANSFGLNDMHGNVWERVADCWHDNYVGAPEDGSVWVDNCSIESINPLRGGSWYVRPVNLRAAFRNWLDTVIANNNVGFRLARTTLP